MIGSIAGDIIGSVYEFHNISNEDFPLFSRDSTFTDDTVLTVATADVILDGAKYDKYYLDYGTTFANRGYGGTFYRMLKTGSLKPYNSYGNGSAMRVGPVGWAYDSMEEVLKEAKRSAECTHDHTEGIKGAQAVAFATYLARKKVDKTVIKKAIAKLGYDLNTRIKDFSRKFDVTCQGTIPRAMAVFMETDNYESAIRKSIAMGGDVDTIGCIVGGICEAYYGMPKREIVEEVYKRIPPHMARITTKFTKKYIDPNFIEPEEIGTDGGANI